MRILMASHGYPPTLSGVTLVVQKVARAMVRRGHEVTVVTASDRKQPYQDEDEGVRLLRVRSLSNPFWKEGRLPFIRLGTLREIASRVRPDVLHTHDAGWLGLQCLRLVRRTRLPIVSTCYYVPRFAARYLAVNGQPFAPVEAVVWRYSIWQFNQFDHVVFATTAHCDSFLEKGMRTPTTIISNGVDVMRYHPPRGEPEDVEERYALPPRPRILFVGRLAQDKEIDILIRAMAGLAARDGAARAAHLLVVGRGDHHPVLERLARELGLQSTVHFLGYVPEEDLPALYRVVDLFAIAATTEVQSLPALQAAATALPMVAADAMALPELVHSGQNGYLVQPGDPQGIAEAMQRILDDSQRAAQMGEASLAIAQPHAEERTFDLYEDLYRRMAKKG